MEIESIFFKARVKLVYEHHSMRTAVRFVYGLQPGPTFVWVMVTAKEFEGIVLRIVVDDAHNLLAGANKVKRATKDVISALKNGC